MFCVDLTTNSDFFSLYSINLSVFKTEAESVYCAVRNGSLNQTVLKGLNWIKAGKGEGSCEHGNGTSVTIKGG